MEKLQKLLSQWGVASRRQAETLVLAGRVSVNGQVAHLGQRANPETDRIEVDGVGLTPATQPRRHYLLLHKPRGVVSTCSDPQNRQTVVDLLPRSLRQGQGIHPVGRLDTDSTGALLLTNDGELTHQLTHPRYHIPKVYRVRVDGVPPDAVLQQWRQGVDLGGRKTLPAQVRLLETSAHHALLEVVLKEGRNRQIRRVAETLGYPVARLHRVAIGPVRLGTLALGQTRPLTALEVRTLRKFTDVSAVALTRRQSL